MKLRKQDSNTVAVVFDLDNTLYDTRQYFLGAFYKIATYLANKYHIDKQRIYRRLINTWRQKTSMYPYLFDNLLSSVGLRKEFKKVIKIFNNYSCNLKPYKELIPVLKELKKRSYKLGIITDGTPGRQKRKIKSLGIKNFFDAVLFTKLFFTPKPSAKPFKRIIKILKVRPNNSFYVGDNPLIDFKGAKEIGMQTVRLIKGEFKEIPRNKDIVFEIKNLTGLLKITR
jgi:putative hydrolase of the HAD superfamily